MKRILNIIRYDLKKITGSVVAIVTIMGLCLVPCCYAWFNILSNWAPYESDATGRIAVAVANMDKGSSAAGLTINVGDKIVEGLESNEDIGWVFTDSDTEAVEGVRSGDYYAALIMPEGFTGDVLSFMDGNLTNPKLIYYENEKKNAIAPKITGKAKTAVQEQVNATFVETLAKYVTDAASIAEANGIDPAAMLKDLSKDIDSLSRDMDGCIALADSASGLTIAAGNIIDVSGSLIDDTQGVLTANDSVLKEIEKSIPKGTKTNSETLKKVTAFADKVKSKLHPIDTGLKPLKDAETAVYKLYLKKNRDKDKKTVDELKANAEKQAQVVSDAGFTVLASDLTALADKLGEVSDGLASLNSDMTEAEREAILIEVLKDLDEAAKLDEEVNTRIKTDIEDNLAAALSNTKSAVTSLRKSLRSANKDLGSLSSGLGSYTGALDGLKKSVDTTSSNLESLQDSSEALSGRLSSAAGSDLLAALRELLSGDEAAVASYLSDPVKMDTEVIWPIANYGSQMAPFYTVLAQWVGALLTAVLIKVRLRKRKELEGLRLYEWYFGRFGLYMLVGLVQALVVAAGDLLYVHIQCLAPGRFILLCCINGIVFMMINYALVFALDNIGLGAGVIILVLQVAGSGGTYPIEVLPNIFKVLYPLMPFRYAMYAMRECIGGFYGNTYWKCIGILMVFFVFSIAFGLALYLPAKRLNEMIAASKAKSEIML